MYNILTQFYMPLFYYVKYCVFSLILKERTIIVVQLHMFFYYIKSCIFQHDQVRKVQIVTLYPILLIPRRMEQIPVVPGNPDSYSDKVLTFTFFMLFLILEMLLKNSYSQSSCLELIRNSIPRYTKAA